MMQNRTWKITGAQIPIAISHITYTVFTLLHLMSTVLSDNFVSPHKMQYLQVIDNTLWFIPLLTIIQKLAFRFSEVNSVSKILNFNFSIKHNLLSYVGFLLYFFLNSLTLAIRPGHLIHYWIII